ncbi:MAG: HPF/RaiA family ribosome-associated protein [Candidatus Eisenbacteria bacterium]
MQLQVNGLHVNLSENLLEHIDKRFRFALDRVESRVARVAVRIADLNGKSAGGAKECKVLVKLRTGDDLVLHEKGTELYDLVDRASEKTKRLVSKRIQKKRTIRRQEQTILPGAFSEEEAE